LAEPQTPAQAASGVRRMPVRGAQGARIVAEAPKEPMWETVAARTQAQEERMGWGHLGIIPSVRTRSRHPR